MSPPLSTYRLQLRPGFGFDEAAALAGYLADLGVTHAYCSPYLQAAPGSAHGYDVVDHSRVNRELGGQAAHERFCAALGEAGLGQVLDIVPNHMAVTPENRWWTDVLENGPASRYAPYFDVDWDPPEPRLRATVLLPVLGDHYGRALEAGDLRLEREGGAFVVTYFEHRFPVAPRSFDTPLSMAAEASGSDELAFLADAFAALPVATVTDPVRLQARHRDKEILKGHLVQLLDERADLAAATDAAVERLNSDPDRLDALLERQNHQLAYWRRAGEVDYRRFFDISSLVALRVEDHRVFADTHALVLGWLRAGVLDGVRIDHPDGLADPGGYLGWLRAEAGQAWVVVEKILARGEELPAWPVQGTTGYDFLNLAGGLFVDPAGEPALTEAYVGFTGEPGYFGEVAHRAKHEAMRTGLAADLGRLTQLFVRLCEASRRYRDFTRQELHDVLDETVACFGVYRTYVGPDGACTPGDARVLEEALQAARERRGDIDPDLFDLLGRVLGGKLAGPEAAELRLRFQQTTGPVTAKGVEDTAFYTFNRLICLNDVGGEPDRFGVEPGAFHRRMAQAQQRWPTTMLASSTHDTKRSEDVRARIALLSEIPEAFGRAVERWSAMNGAHRSGGWPDANLEWLLYQTLVGAHPLSAERALPYVEKATREAKAHTSWTDPDPDYDEAVRRFVEAVLSDETFLADLSAFVAPLVEPGWVTALALQLLKLSAPGVPDVYQGTEIWDDSLVDPDNRRPVDFDRRRRLLAELDGLEPERVWARAAEGLPKLAVTRAALHLRRARPEAFGAGLPGRYEALTAAGRGAAHVVAFSRGAQVVTVVPRLVMGLASAGGWGETTLALPSGAWRDVLGGEALPGGDVPVATLLGRLPVALLVREGGAP